MKQVKSAGERRNFLFLFQNGPFGFDFEWNFFMTSVLNGLIGFQLLFFPIELRQQRWHRIGCSECIPRNFKSRKWLFFFGATAEITQPDLMEHCCHEYAYLLVRCGFAGFTAILSTALSRRMKCFHQNNLLTRVWINFTALIQFPARPPLVVQPLKSAAYANELIFISFNDASWMSV